MSDCWPHGHAASATGGPGMELPVFGTAAKWSEKVRDH